MRYLGIDYGAKRVGLAVSDADGRIAFPRVTLPNDERLVKEIAQFAADERVDRIVIGDTRTSGGAANPITKDAEAFIATLRERTALPIDSAFELWSSIEASRYAPEGAAHDDASAAAVILQRYLDFHGGRVQ